MSTTPSLMARPAARAIPTRPIGWRDWNLLVLAGLHVYSAAIGWQAQAVSYPLYRSVGADGFLDYHAAYNDAIPLVVIVPGFLTFLGAAAFPWTRPHDVPRGIGALIGGAGLVSLLSTVLWAIPRHDDLDRLGRDAGTIDSLLQANAVRVAALSAGTLAIGAVLGRRLRRP